jgi:hypothetical protein
MALQSVGLSLPADSQLTKPQYDRPTRNQSSGAIAPRSTLNATMTAEYYKASSFALEYTSGDGDKVSLSFQSVEYQKTMLGIEAEGDEQSMQDLVKLIQEEYKNLQKQVLKEFVKSIGGKVDEVGETAQPTLQIPDYWNAENTSQRIVDFAVSFFDAFSGAGDEFLTKIKDAIEQGFSQAREMLGELPDQVSQLVNDTHDLVMSKLDAWAVQKGITAAAEEQTA